ncbi:MAG: hypothetical protein ACR2IV_12445 [Bryobacteraceae bacterium]
MTRSFPSGVQTRLENEREERRRTGERWASGASQGEIDVKPLDYFRRDPKYLGDNTRIDLAYAVYALSRGVAAGDVMAALRSRDLSHKGNERRQNEYIERTVRKARRAIEGVGRE